MESLYKVEDHFLNNETENVDSMFAVQGFSFAGSGQNAGQAAATGAFKGAIEDADAIADREPAPSPVKTWRGRAIRRRVSFVIVKGSPCVMPCA